MLRDLVASNPGWVAEQVSEAGRDAHCNCTISSYSCCGFDKEGEGGDEERVVEARGPWGRRLTLSGLRKGLRIACWLRKSNAILGLGTWDKDALYTLTMNSKLQSWPI